MLHYLATGEELAPEHLLPLNKVLVGLEIDETIERAVELSAEEKAEAEKLLSRRYRARQALKSTSIGGLRGSFLGRPGLLRANEEGWLLQVERHAFDALLDSLPWSIAMIKLSWMKGLLAVEW